ncbi:hypothetical protein sscle_15g104980 [Sclerotinia sclerotiorum 1980 UF-70]|uniref:Carrier domain-containing protein n=1 Tax=Sclerotinia sclerotiorum (strain ATCC 18683 / 1980 / Ss-1) TaxID=665079 RepID=A0A1D9QLB0_SCLS1|nr:hypothetical protein sscle_15g104980 [Sclerotinia sclerotiorum 1980 UF-70]
MPTRNWKNELVPKIVDNIAEVDPDALYAEYPVSTVTYDQGYRKITFADFANAVNCVAWWLHETLGPGKGSEVLAYIGPNDLRYPALMLGAAKAGYLIFLTSPRNSVAAQINLLERLKCTNVLSPTPCPPQITAILEANTKLRVLEVPTVDHLLDEKHRHFPYEKSFDEVKDEPFVIVHTSGSTGFPKPMVWTHDTAQRNIALMALGPPPGYEGLHQMYEKKRVFLTFPPFHGAYLCCHLFNAVPFGTVMISPTSGAIPSAKGLVEGLQKSPADIAFIVPSIVSELSQSPDLLDYCAKNLEMIIYCGGDLPQATGDIVASKIRLVNQFGATELGLSNLILRNGDYDRNDWKYIEVHPDIGAEFRSVINETHELTMIRNSKLEKQQPTFTMFPQSEEYATRDLFIRHPTKPNLWKWHARADDIIVFLNGEKTNPISMEQHIVARNPEVQAALVMGAQRFQASLLIDPVNGDTELSTAQRAALIEKIWPSVEEANQKCPAHAKIAKTHIFFTNPKKRMLIAGKGTVQRAGTLQMYQQELDALYADADSMVAEFDGENSADINLDDPLTVSEFLKEVILSVTSWTRLDINEDFFSRGMDSLQALTAVRKLRRGLGITSIASSTLYTNPSIAQLTSAVLKLAKDDTSVDVHQDTLQVRDSMLKEFQNRIDSVDLPSATSHKQIDMNQEIVVLTGSTGTLGSYILESLLENPQVAHIYCLNRSSSGKVPRPSRSSTADKDPANPRITFLTTDLTKPNLGLQSEDYTKLLQANRIIHNAWPVNFNLSLASFRPSIEGLFNLLTLAISSTGKNFFFISSISSVMSYKTASGSTPEKIILPSTNPYQPTLGPNGYAESKYLSELLISYASDKFSTKGYQFSLARVGQIAGPVKNKGIWNKTEWLPSLILSSIHISCIPSSLGSSLGKIDWVPVDLLADIIVELTLYENKEKETQIQVFHPLNPHPTTWENVKEDLVADLSSITGKEIDIVPLDIWIARVKQDVESKAGVGKMLIDGELDGILEVNPAVKLIDFYEDVLGDKGVSNVLEVEGTMRVSGALRGLERVQRGWIGKWIGEWVGV